MEKIKTGLIKSARSVKPLGSAGKNNRRGVRVGDMFRPGWLMKQRRGPKRAKLRWRKNEKPLVLLNVPNYRRIIDGLYRSYWVGKLTKSFIKQGKAQTIEKHFYSFFQLMYLEEKKKGSLVICEILDSIRPILGLRRKRVSRRRFNVYPYLLPKLKQYSLAVRWLKKEIDYYWKYERKFYDRVSAILTDKAEIVKNYFVERRSEMLLGAIENRQYARHR
jgi:ribosomal protein S7